MSTQKVTKITPQAPDMMRTDKKEWIATYTMLAGSDVYPMDRLARPIEARFYRSKSADGASPVYCKLWVHGNYAAHVTHGYGVARGYGYDKMSEALEKACMHAGIDFLEAFGGTGETGSRAALEALAEDCGWKDAQFMRFFG